MGKEKIIVYGCGQFFCKNRENIESKFNIIGQVDKSSKIADYTDFRECKEEYSFILIMIARMDIVFEVIVDLINNGINAEKILLGISLFENFCDDVEIHVTEDAGICVSISDRKAVVYDDISFWDFAKRNIIPCLEEKSNELEQQLLSIHQRIFDIKFSGGVEEREGSNTLGVLSFNHDNDLFYRFPKYGMFGWGLIAALNLRTIYCFEKPYVLDLGCADGFYYRRFYSHIKSLKYIGCDIDKDSLEYINRYKKDNQCDAEFLYMDFVENMPRPIGESEFTNIFWYASMHMFDDTTQKNILQNIKTRLGNSGILSGSVSIRKNDWKYCINPLDSEEQVMELLKKYFNHVYVYHDAGMGDDAIFLASQSNIPLMGMN